MTALLPTLAASLCLLQVSGPDKQLLAIKQQADEVGKAVLAEDYFKVVDLTLPKVVELLGGRSKMVETMRAGTKEMKSQGITFHAIKVDPPKEVVKAGPDLIAVVPEVVTMKVPGGKVHQKSYLLAVSADQGRTWKFLDGAGVAGDNLKQVLPNLPKEVKLPKKEEPVFEKDK
jgi:hypothetical protein